MNETTRTAAPLPLNLEQASYVLGDLKRCLLLRELSRGQALPVGELTRRVGCTRDSISRQLASLCRMGVVQKVYGHLYALAPAYQPKAGETTLDLGHFVVRLDTPAS